MKKEELKRIVEYINQEIKTYISTDNSETNDIIQEGFFTEKEFIDKNIVELND